jgi:hypothetical protein
MLRIGEVVLVKIQPRLSTVGILQPVCGLPLILLFFVPYISSQCFNRIKLPIFVVI